MERYRRVALGSALSAALILAVAAKGQEWTRFRGPNGSGSGPTATVPLPFSAGDYNWRIELPGIGHSSPVLWGNKIFVTSAEESLGKRHVLCLDAQDGHRLWSKTYEFKTYAHHRLNSSASSTPCVDAERVYVMWPAQDSFRVMALDHRGNEVWQREFGTLETQHGGAASPILVGDTVILAKEPEEGEGFLAALDCKTGATRWQYKHASETAAYSTPILYDRGGAQELIFTTTARGFTSLDPKTGRVNWELGSVFRARCVGGPVIARDLIFAAAGNGGGDRQAVAVRPGPKAEGTGASAAARVAYEIKRGASYVPTPIVVDNRLYLWGDGGVVTCVRAESGEQVWMERTGGNFYGSPISVNGKLWAMSAKGELVVLETGDQFKQVCRIDLGEASHATPAVAGGVMYLRTQSHLISIGGKKK